MKSLSAMLLVLLIFAATARAQNYVLQDIRIPEAAAGPQGLEGLLARPAGRGPFPLALISHGMPRDGAERPRMMPRDVLPQMMEFARRGWAVATVMRRGFGLSGGGWAEDSGPCDHSDFIRAGRAGAADLAAAFAALSRRAEIDAHHMIAVGVSAGAFATIALTENPPPGLVAAISFAGGRGAKSDDQVCDEPALIQAFHTFGQRSRTPMLWVYAANDHVFDSRLAARLQQAFTEAGGRVTFVEVAAFGSSGHLLFASPQGRPIWTPLVDAFLAQEHLPRRAPLLPAYASPSL
jgi:dienelactone hydrolase